MKRIYTIFLTIIITFFIFFSNSTLIGCSSNNVNFDFNIPETSANAFIYQIHGDGVYITGLTQYGKKLNKIHIPKLIDKKEVVGLKNTKLPVNPEVFDYSSLDETSFICNADIIVLPSTIKNISKYFFTKTSANAIKIHGNLERIPDYSFRNSSIKNIFIDEGIVEIGNGAFVSSDIEMISLPSSLKIIKDSAFKFCEKLSNVIFNEGLEIIENFAFSGCFNLRVMHFPNSLKLMNSYIFSPNSYSKDMKLEKVIIGKEIQFIDSSAFNGCKGVSLYCYAQNPPCEDLTNVNTFYILQENYGNWVKSKKINKEKLVIFDPLNTDFSVQDQGCSSSFNFITWLFIIIILGTALSLIKEITERINKRKH